MDIYVISSEKYGKELKREKHKHSYHTVCKGKRDDDVINEAIQSLRRGRSYAVSGEAWERIFEGE